MKKAQHSQMDYNKIQLLLSLNVMRLSWDYTLEKFRIYTFMFSVRHFVFFSYFFKKILNDNKCMNVFFIQISLISLGRLNINDFRGILLSVIFCAETHLFPLFKRQKFSHFKRAGDFNCPISATVALIYNQFQYKCTTNCEVFK